MLATTVPKDAMSATVLAVISVRVLGPEVVNSETVPVTSTESPMARVDSSNDGPKTKIASDAPGCCPAPGVWM